MLAPQSQSLLYEHILPPDASDYMCLRVYSFASATVWHSTLKNQRRVDLQLNSRQPSAKPLRANDDLVHTDMLVPLRRVMKPAAPLSPAARHALKIGGSLLYHTFRCTVQQQKWPATERLWEEAEYDVMPLYTGGVGGVCSSSYKGVDVGQALPPHEHQGQRWMEEKVA